MVQSTPPVVEGEVREVVKLEICVLQDVGIVAVVEIVDEDENGEAEAEAPERVA